MDSGKRAFLEEKLRSEEFETRRRRASLFVDTLSGPGLGKKIKRLLFTPGIYLPYLIIAKTNWYRNKMRTTRLFWGREVRIPFRDWDSLHLCLYGLSGGDETELKLTRFLVKNLAHDDVFYDVGANYGFFTYLATELCGEVHAFEPVPGLAEVIRANTSRDAKVFVNADALADTDGRTDLFISETPGLSTINVATTTMHPTYSYDRAKTVSVATVKLDSYVARHARPTVMKIDVEGAEESVIVGGEQVLARYAPIVIIEVWGARNGGDVSMKAVEKLRSLGYASFRIDAEGNVHEIEGDLSALGSDNYVFKKKRASV